MKPDSPVDQQQVRTRFEVDMYETKKVCWTHARLPLAPYLHYGPCTRDFRMETTYHPKLKLTGTLKQ